MKVPHVDIRLVSTWPSEEIVALYKAGGWWKESYDPSGISSLIQESTAFAVAVHEGRAVGMVRLISDGVSDAYIQDLVVLPAFRGHGIGKKIVQTLLNHCLEKGILWIVLIAEPGRRDFFASLGFEEMKGHVPMRYRVEE